MTDVKTEVIIEVFPKFGKSFSYTVMLDMNNTTYCSLDNKELCEKIGLYKRIGYNFTGYYKIKSTSVEITYEDVED